MMESGIEKWLEDTGFGVIVAGGGPAGLAAAVSASRAGANVLLIEQRAFLGGVASLGLWMPINNAFLASTGEPRGGFPRMLAEKLQRFGPVAGRLQRRELIGEPFLGYHVHPEYLKLAAFELLEDHGVSYLLHTRVVEALIGSDGLSGVILQGRSTRFKAAAPVIIDATGDCDVSALAGVEWQQGREGDGFVAPMTLLFAIGGVDTNRYVEFRRAGGDLKAILKEGISEGYTVPEGAGVDAGTVPGVVSVNSAGSKALGSLDGTNVWDLTRAERHGRLQAVDFVRLMRDKRVPGFESSYLLFVAPEIAVRETRRIVGEYTLTEEDVTTGKRFDDVVARRYGVLDIGFTWLARMASPHDVPYGCLVPRGVDNLLVAGRGVSASFIATQAGRCMGNQMMVGMAAGVAAALAVAKEKTPRELEVSEIQRALTDQGADLDLPG
jgi:hypothetical protein